MSEHWAQRQRRTNQLTRLLASHVFKNGEPTPQQLYGLSRLSWITQSYDDNAPRYIRSTKIPALEDIFDVNYRNASLSDIAADIEVRTGIPSCAPIVEAHTGFTNLYNAYRNSVREWITTHYDKLLPLYKAAWNGGSSDQRLAIVRAIAKLPGIPKANHSDQLMQPEYFLTPAFFSLDPDIRFPLINGNEWVKNLLSALKVRDSSLENQYGAMIQLYNVGGISDAADLDQVGRDLPSFLSSGGRPAKRQLLTAKDTDEHRTLPLKDERDIEVIRQTGLAINRRIHNQLTNSLKTEFSNYTLYEGSDPTCMFDVQVKNYNGHNDDLLIEVKSSSDQANVRMAIGQLFDYWFNLHGTLDGHHLAILLPDQPSPTIINLLSSMDVGLFWFHEGMLQTSTYWLEHLGRDKSLS